MTYTHTYIYIYIHIYIYICMYVCVYMRGDEDKGKQAFEDANADLLDESWARDISGWQSSPWGISREKQKCHEKCHETTFVLNYQWVSSYRWVKSTLVVVKVSNTAHIIFDDFILEWWIYTSILSIPTVAKLAAKSPLSWENSMVFLEVGGPFSNFEIPLGSQPSSRPTVLQCAMTCVRSPSSHLDILDQQLWEHEEPGDLMGFRDTMSFRQHHLGLKMG